MSSRFATLGVATLLIQLPLAAGAVTVSVKATTPEGTPVNTQFVVLDAGGNQVATGTTNEDPVDLPPGAYTVKHEGARTPVEVSSAASQDVELDAFDCGFDAGFGLGYGNHFLDASTEIVGITSSFERDFDLHGGQVDLYARARIPYNAFGGQPFVEAGGKIPFVNYEDKVGQEGQLGVTGLSSVKLQYDGGLYVSGGLEYSLPCGCGDKPLRLRPSLGVQFDWYTGNLIADEREFLGPTAIERTSHDITYVGLRPAVELGLPVGEYSNPFGIDVVLGFAADLPLSGDEDLSGPTPGGFTALGNVDLGPKVLGYVRTEFRFTGN